MVSLSESFESNIQTAMLANVWPKHAAPLAAYRNDLFVVGRGKRG
jgi:hypothetical protein